MESLEECGGICSLNALKKDKIKIENSYKSIRGREAKRKSHSYNERLEDEYRVGNARGRGRILIIMVKLYKKISFHY